MDKKKLIKRYENMMYRYGECDVWEDDVKPKLENKSVEEIKAMYEEDKEFYKSREAAGGCW